MFVFCFVRFLFGFWLFCPGLYPGMAVAGAEEEKILRHFLSRFMGTRLFVSVIPILKWGNSSHSRIYF